MMQEDATVFIVDDDVAVRRSLQALVGSIGFASEAFASAEELLEVYDHARPGCIVADLRMPGMSGIELFDHMRAQDIRTPFIILTAYGDVKTTKHAIQHGAVDYMEKPVDPELLAKHIRLAVERDAVVRMNWSKYLQIKEAQGRLSPRESEVLCLMLSGKASKEIASELDVSSKTIDKHRANVMSKLGAKNSADLACMVMWATAVDRNGPDKAGPPPL